MAYSIKYFRPEKDKEDPLKALCYIQNVSDKYVMLVNGVQSTYASNIWSSLLCKEFGTNPSLFIRDNWENLDFLNSIVSSFNGEVSKLRNRLSVEQQFIFDNQYAKAPKSGSSFISVKLEANKIIYSMLGDNFLFIYNKKTESLLAYCSMVEKNGKLDLSQPCHCIYNDLTLLGTPINGEISFKDSICFIFSRDIASWFVDNCRDNISLTINTLFSISNNDDYNKLLRKIQSQQRYKGNPFDKSTSYCMIIQKDQNDVNHYSFDKIRTWCKKYIIACCIAVFVLILSLFFIFGNKEEKAKIEKEKTVSAVVDNYKYYHDMLADRNLSFQGVKSMLEKADREELKEKNKLLYDTICYYAHFVNRYNVNGRPRLRMALKDLFSNTLNSTYTIRDGSGSLVLSTNLKSGEINFFRDSHKRNLVNLFIGKYNDNNEIQQYTDEEKQERYTRAVANCHTWKSFADMK